MQLQIFKYNKNDNPFGDIRMIEQEDGTILFAGIDVAKILGYKSPGDAVTTHCKAANIFKIYVNHDGAAGGTMINFIPESEIYRLIIRSQLKSAEAFGDWVFEQVLPSIRKKGYYGKIDRTALPNFITRYKDNYHKLPADHFSVISEMYARLYLALEKVGYSVPDMGAHGKQMMPDISVGRGFAKYLKEKKSDFFNSHKTYTHTFPDGREVEANMYHIDALPVFIKYIHEKWIPEKAETYFKDKDPLAIEYLPKLLKASH